MINLDQAHGDGVLPDGKSWTVTAPGVDGVGVRPRAARNPDEELTHRRAGRLDRHAASIGEAVSKRLARQIADRYLALRAGGLDPREAERRAFGEHLASGRADLTNVYPEFIAAANPNGRRLHGVYYTPSALVGAQVRLVDDALRRHLGYATGLADERILIVDPSTGSGAYPLAIRDLIGGAPPQMRLYEPMPGAALLARAEGLNVEERDALSTTEVFDAPVVVCIGNPPYRRARAVHELVDGFSTGAGGIHRKNLYNDYVYFWRWALRTVFETREGAGVVCFVTAASYVRGPAFVGMRQHLRRVLDALWVVDLEGDQLAARVSHNVFPIRTPVAIALGLRRGARSPSEPAAVRYVRLGGSRQDKLEALESITSVDDLDWQVAGNASGAPLSGRRQTEYWAWPALTDLFPWQLSGAQLKRTWPIGPIPEVLRSRWQRLLQLHDEERLRAFGPTRDRDLDSTPPDLLDPAERLGPLRSLASGADSLEPVRYAYRSFDRQWLIPDTRLGDFMRPVLWRVAGPRQVFLTSLLTNVLGPGPAVVASACVPDLDHFRGSFGARAVIPLWRDAAATEPNASGAWLRRLSKTFGFDVDGESLMAYCYALLATRGYVRRFEEELRVPGARVPITPHAEVFRRCAEVGRELLAVHTYRHVSPGVARPQRPIGQPYPRSFAYRPSTGTLDVGEGEIGPIHADVWNYSVSGYHVVRGWLRQRISRRQGKSALDAIQPEAWTRALTDELLQLLWLVEATLALEPTLDALLTEVLSGGLGQGLLVGGEELVGEAVGPERLREDEALSLVAPEPPEVVPL